MALCSYIHALCTCEYMLLILIYISGQNFNLFGSWSGDVAIESHKETIKKPWLHTHADWLI